MTTDVLDRDAANGIDRIEKSVYFIINTDLCPAA
jgi:hypothetical protein